MITLRLKTTQHSQASRKEKRYQIPEEEGNDKCQNDSQDLHL